jgi:hypothetical protein
MKPVAVRAALLACLAASAATACTGSDGVASPGEGVFVPSPPTSPPVSPPTSPPVSPPGGPAASCPSGFVNVGIVANLRNCQLPALITGTLNLPNISGVIYSISGRVNVGVDLGADPAAPLAGGQQGILSIDPGVRVFGSGTLDYIVVNRGSQISAVGSAANPIVFTSRQSVEGSNGGDSIGQWGGLVILGRAPTAAGCPAGPPAISPPNIACVAQVEGTNAFYGGATPADNSGRLSFVRVQHSGFEILPNNELNGITLAGVGNGTVVENVQVHNSSDDGIEIFGGTVNLRNIVLTGNDDDSLDVDTGWRGAVQYLLVVQRPNGGDRGFEFSSAGTRTAQTPPAGQPTAAFTLNTTPYISNATVVTRAAGGDALVLNSGNGLRLWNSVVNEPAGGGACLDIDDADTFTAAPTFNGVFFSCPTAFNSDADDEAARFNAGAGNTPTGTSTLAVRGSSTASFVNGANENGVTAQAVANLPGSTFLQAVTRIGAVHTGNDTWYQGWTCSPLIGEEAC